MTFAVALMLSLSTTAAPPCIEITNHGAAHNSYPTVRVFERRSEDQFRRTAWMAYSRELNLLWFDYRAAGSTPAAFRRYQAAAGQARRRYLIGDPYLTPVVQ